MMTSLLNKAKETKTRFDDCMDSIGKFLDQNPTAYKVTLFASHAFRSLGIYSMIITSPVNPIATTGIILASSLLYRAGIERFCIFRFTLPSLAGGLSLWMAKASIASLIGPRTLFTLGRVLGGSLGIIPLAAYTIYIYKISSDDIEAKNAKSRSCCT